MNALHEAVTRAIADALGVRTGPLGERVYPEEWAERAAAAAVGVVLAEATRSIEREFTAEHDVTHALAPYYAVDVRAARATMAAEARVLAVLAALGEQA